MILLALNRDFNVTRAYVNALDGPALTVGYDKEATQSYLLRPPGGADIKPEDIRLEVTDSAAGQYQNGRIVLLANHAVVHGATAKLESQPGNERIGFWSNPQDFVSWDYKATRPGRYEVFLTYSCAEKGGTKITVEIGKEKLDGVLTTTQNGWYGYTWMKLGGVSIPAAGPLTVSVRCREMVGGAVMNLKAITLMPACEGTPPVQAPGGTVTLHAKDATIWGVQAQYEPKPQKNTIGFWTHTTDTASWVFSVTKPGEFAIEILQGCGKGQGGSKVEIEVSDERQRVLTPFTVEDTGHFQNFVARNIGAVTLDRAGEYTLVVRPVSRAGVAVMDLRQVRLLPK
jgi:hypothetical protein